MPISTDQFSRRFPHSITVRLKTGNDGSEDTFGSGVSYWTRVSEKLERRVVGDRVTLVNATTVSVPVHPTLSGAATAVSDIPKGSRIALPSPFDQAQNHLVDGVSADDPSVMFVLRLE